MTMSFPLSSSARTTIGPLPPILASLPPTPLNTTEWIAFLDESKNRKSSRLVETDSAEQVSIPTISIECRGPT